MLSLAARNRPDCEVRWSGDALLSFALPLLQKQPDAMQVGRQHRQSDRPREAVRAITANAVESPMLQPIDGRLDSRMRTPRGRKRFLLFPRPGRPRCRSAAQRAAPPGGLPDTASRRALLRPRRRNPDTWSAAVLHGFRRPAPAADGMPAGRTAHPRAVQDVCHNPAAALWRRAPLGGNPRAAPRQAAAGAVPCGASSGPGRARCESDLRAVACSHASVVRYGCPADPAPAGMHPGRWTAAARAYRGYRLRSTAPAVRSAALLPRPAKRILPTKGTSSVASAPRCRTSPTTSSRRTWPAGGARSESLR